jgi:hypothetical protein
MMKNRCWSAVIAAGLTLSVAQAARAAGPAEGLPIDGMSLGMTVAEMRKQRPVSGKKVDVGTRKGLRGGAPRAQYYFTSDSQAKHTVPGDFWRVQLYTAPAAIGHAASDADQVLSVLASSESMQIPADLTLAQLRAHYEKSFGPPAAVWKMGLGVMYLYYEAGGGRPEIGAMSWDSIPVVTQMDQAARFCFEQRSLVRRFSVESSKLETGPGEVDELPKIEQMTAEALASIKACGRVAILHVTLRDISISSTVANYVVETVDYAEVLKRLR